MRLAVLSDVHGNAVALDAVLADIVTQSVDATLCLGDHVSGPMDPAGVAERLMTLDGPMIAGNHDRWVVEPRQSGQGTVDRFAAEQLSEVQHKWLAALPATAVFNNEISFVTAPRPVTSRIGSMAGILAVLLFCPTKSG